MNSTKHIHFLQVLLLFCLCDKLRAFVETPPGRMKRNVMVDRNFQLEALTERQEQFWEDVEDGLDDIEKYYRDKGENIDRIRRFGMR